MECLQLLSEQKALLWPQSEDYARYRVIEQVTSGKSEDGQELGVSTTASARSQLEAARTELMRSISKM